MAETVIPRGDFKRSGYYSWTDFQWKKAIVWEHGTGGITVGSLALYYNNKVYYVTHSGLIVYAADNGSILWTWNPKEDIKEYSYVANDPIIHDKTLYLSLSPSSLTAHTALVALDPEDGKILKRYYSDIIGEAKSPIVFDNSMILARGSKLVSIDMESGQEKWEFDAQQMVWKLSLHDNTLFFGTNGGSGMYAIDAASGTKKWSGRRNGLSLGYTATSEGRAFIGTLTGVNAVDLETGNLIWSQNKVGFAMFEFAVDEDTLYGGSKKGLFAVNKFTGAVKWINRKANTVAAPSIVGNVLLVAMDDSVTAISKKKGRILWRVKGLGYDALVESPTPYGGRIFIRGGNKYDYKLYRID